MRGRVGHKLLPLLYKQRKVAQLAVLHDEVDVGSRLDAIMEGDDMRMPKRLQDLDFSIQILFELLVETGELDGFDSNQGTSNLWEAKLLATGVKDKVGTNQSPDHPREGC